MGLDMYLSCKVYLSEYDERKEVKEAIEQTKSIASSFGFPSSWIPQEIVFEAIYWRKANAIHNWFVQNIQGCVDDCGSYDVSPSDIKELLKVINNILNEDSKKKQIELINELLPPTSGFFFDSTEVDEYYFDDLNYTKEGLEKLLELYGSDAKRCWSLEYQSSW
jgi:hypothetical protein